MVNLVIDKSLRLLSFIEMMLMLMLFNDNILSLKLVDKTLLLEKHNKCLSVRNVIRNKTALIRCKFIALLMETRKPVNQEKHFECQNKLKTIQSYNLLMKRNLFRMASTTLVKTVFSQTKPLTTALPGCGDVGDTTLKRSIDLTVGVLIATLNIIEIIIIAKIKREKNV